MKVAIAPISTLSQLAIDQINQNFTRLQTAMENTLSRDGTTPNEMIADLDLNGNDILNAGVIFGKEIVVDGITLSTTRWLVGQTPPLESTGLVNDLYLDSSTGDVYGPKGVTWGLPVSNIRGPRGFQGERGLTGEKGDTGTQGPQGLSFDPDAVGPTADRSLYNTRPRDFSFLDITTGTLFFKRSATSGDWTPGLPFGKGEVGPRGPEGPQGEPGVSGNGELVDPRTFGAKFDGVTVDTVAMQQAIDFAAANGRVLSLPAGTTLCGNLILKPRLNMVGRGPVQTTIKCTRAAGASGVFIGSSVSCDDLVLKEFGIDGGRVAGDGVGASALRVYGNRPTLDNLTIINARGWGLLTDHDFNDRTYSILGSFKRITIDRTGAGGWEHRGPNDSHAAGIEIVDVSQAVDAAYPGFATIYLEGADQGTISVDNMHIWNRTTGLAVSRPSCALYVGAGGQKFSNSLFESGAGAVVILAGGLNMFENCAAFAPDGPVPAVLIQSPYNRFTGMVGGNKDFFYPNYYGVSFQANAVGNVIDVFDAGCSLGAVDFTGSGGNNVVRVRGYKAGGEATWTGIPRGSDQTDISTDGPGGRSLIKERDIPWTELPVSTTTTGGGLTSAYTTVRYRIVGRVVHFNAFCQITTNGSGSGVMQIPLPIAPQRATACAGTTGSLVGLSALALPSGVVSIVTTSGAYPGANGAQIFVSGTYEIN